MEETFVARYEVDTQGETVAGTMTITASGSKRTQNFRLRPRTATGYDIDQTLEIRDDGIYITEFSRTIYGGGRRRVDSSVLRGGSLLLVPSTNSPTREWTTKMTSSEGCVVTTTKWSALEVTDLTTVDGTAYIGRRIRSQSSVTRGAGEGCSAVPAGQSTQDAIFDTKTGQLLKSTDTSAGSTARTSMLELTKIP